MARVPYIIEANEKGDGEKVHDVWSRMLRDRIIFISGTFDQDMADSVVAQLLYLETADSTKDISIYINSGGGQIDAMYAIYDCMNYIKPEIVTIGMGIVASAASFILAAGTKGKRFALPNTEVMIHELSTGVRGKANDIFNSVKFTERLYHKMAQHYVDFTGQDLEKVKLDMQRDYYMTSEEALAYGIIDKIEVKRL